MDLVNNSTIATVIDYANVNLAWNLQKNKLLTQLKKLSPTQKH